VCKGAIESSSSFGIRNSPSQMVGLLGFEPRTKRL
jgi:hypothetical protein